jgi:hypothetical protein
MDGMTPTFSRPKRGAVSRDSRSQLVDCPVRGIAPDEKRRKHNTENRRTATLPARGLEDFPYNAVHFPARSLRSCW